MKQRVNPKVHAKIPPHPRGLCGLVPKNGHYIIVSLQEFFTEPDADQCAACLKKLTARGYNINLLRIQYRAIHDRAQELALAA
ncbi:MAG: hypothetical protein WC742_12480 [Gallionellaceae bacterium]|jgi:hypothetical protein